MKYLTIYFIIIFCCTKTTIADSIDSLIVDLSQMEDTAMQIVTYVEAGNEFIINKELDKAQNLFENALQLAIQTKDTGRIRSLNNKLAFLYRDKKQYELSSHYNKEALLSPNLPVDSSILLFESLISAQLILDDNFIDSAIVKGQKGLAFAKRLKNSDQTEWAYKVLFSAYKKNSDYKKAAIVAEQLIVLKDSINDEKFNTSIAEKETKIKLLQKDQQLLHLEKKQERATLLRNSILIVAVGALLFLLLLLNRKRLVVKIQQRELDHLNFLKEIERKEKQNLEEQLSIKEKVLASTSMNKTEKKEILTILKEQISALSAENDLGTSRVSNTELEIKQNLFAEKEWSKFKIYIDDAYPLFLKNLQQKYPVLNNNDLRFCAYMKMGLSTKEIAQLSGVNATSIQKARYRLKKKMNLDKSIDLINFINTKI